MTRHLKLLDLSEPYTLSGTISQEWNKTSPIRRDSTAGVTLLDNTSSSAVTPNRVRDLTSNPGNNSTFGTLSLRRRVQNNTGGSVTRLRFRIVEVTTGSHL
jgi:hypothetical protein